MGNILRGVLGLSLRTLCCTTGLEACDRCPARTDCLYQYLFESKQCGEPNDAVGFHSAPHPFVMEAPAEQFNLGQGDPLDFTLVLFGKAIKSLPSWVLAIKDLCQRGLGRGRVRFDLETISDPSGQIVYDSKSEKTLDLLPETWMYSRNAGMGDKCEIEFLTPCRIKHEGKLSDRLEFPVLITNILRRASAISRHHCDSLPDIDFKSLIDKARNVRIERSGLYWTERPRFSSRQKTRMTLGGVKGRVVYRGDMTEFASLLQFGEIAHLGKATAFGMGQYRHSALP